MYQREYEERLRVSMVGAGSHTYRNLLPALHYLPVELEAICNRGEEKLWRTEREYHCSCYTSTAEMYKREESDTVILNRGIPFEYAYTDNFAPIGDESGAIVWKPQNCLATLENKSLYLQGMVPELECFCQAVIKGTDAGYTSLEFAMEVMKVYEAALRSAGKRIDLSCS